MNQKLLAAFEAAERGLHFEEFLALLVPEWLPMDTAPKDGTLIRLLVKFSDYSLSDEPEPTATIGGNYFTLNEIDEWQFVGWDWEYDHFRDGKGTVIGWLPMLGPL